MKKIDANFESDSLEDRVKENESFFCSFLDLIPNRIYFNQDDRHNWIQMVQTSADKRRKPQQDEPSAKKQKSMTTNEKEFDTFLDEDDENNEELENGNVAKPNRFDPKFFKTVSQILKDLEQLTKSKNNKINNKQIINKMKQNIVTNGNSNQDKNTSIKVLNKSQNKSSKNSNNSNNNKTNESQQSKKAQKRASKFKEAKREAIKRQRQRYDSQTEPQIVNIGHTDANTTQKDRKPILNKNGQVVFSKFDFTADKTLKTKSKSDSKLTPANAKPKDYKKLLKKLQEEKEKKEQLKQSEPEKASELEQKAKWKSAIDKASGVKVKDDVDMLKKAVKRMDKKKDKSRKNWQERSKKVEEHKKQLQDKRQKNIEKRKEKKKEGKIKRLKKKGRILSAGF